MLSEAVNLWTLFLSAFIAATLFPGGSEVMLAYMNQSMNYSTAQLLTVATLGNTLGALSSYAIGWLIIWRFPNNKLDEARSKAVARIKNWGTVSLLFSWVPIIGDPLCVAAGYLKINVLLACTLFAIGKFLRYAFIIWVSNPVQ